MKGSAAVAVAAAANAAAVPLHNGRPAVWPVGPAGGTRLGARAGGFAVRPDGSPGASTWRARGQGKGAARTAPRRRLIAVTVTFV